MQEDVRLFCLPLSGALWRSVCAICVCFWCVRVSVCAVCAHTVGVCGWLFVLNGHLYSSFMSRAAILRDRVVCMSVS